MATISMDSSRVVVLDIRYAAWLLASGLISHADRAIQGPCKPCGAVSLPPQPDEEQALQDAGMAKGLAFALRDI